MQPAQALPGTRAHCVQGFQPSDKPIDPKKAELALTLRAALAEPNAKTAATLYIKCAKLIEDPALVGKVSKEAWANLKQLNMFWGKAWSKDPSLTEAEREVNRTAEEGLKIERQLRLQGIKV